MNRRLQHSVGTVNLLLVALLLSLVCMPRFARADQTTDDITTVTVQVPMFQEYKVDISGLQNTFEYVIEPSEEGAPLPVDEGGKAFNKFTLTRNARLELEFPVQVAVDPEAKTYVYHYMVRPVQKELPDGLYYVDVMSTSLEAGVNEYMLEIHVYPSITNAVAPIVVPTVHVEGWDGPKVSDPGWRISYKAPDKEQNNNQDNKSDASPANKQATSSSSTSNPATAQQTSSSTTSLATTGDPLPDGSVLACVAVVGALLIGGASLRLRKAGDHHA